jgi:hypothetical protein
MAKGAPNLGDLANRVYDLLRALNDDERTKVLNSVHHLFGESAPPSRDGTGAHHTPPGSGQPRHTSGGPSTPQQFYAQKNPATNGGVALNKGEMLAVAARYREQQGQGNLHAADDFSRFFTDVRANFDRRNFPRDIKNAQHQAMLFIMGGPRGQYQLSYYGQQYVDALPDRDAAKKIKRPGRRKAPKKKKGG